MPWKPGESIVRREVLRGKPWPATTVFVVVDEPRLLASYIPEGEGARIGAMLAAGAQWWDEAWSRRSPPRDWVTQPLPEGWDVV